MKTLQQWLEEQKRLCEETPQNELAIDLDLRPGGSDQIILKKSKRPRTVAFMSSGWYEGDMEDCTNPYTEFFVQSHKSLPLAVKIIRALVDTASQDGMVYGGEIEEIVERIINEQK